MARPKKEMNGEIITTKNIDFENKIALFTCMKNVIDEIDKLISYDTPSEEDIEKCKNEEYENGYYHNYIKNCDKYITIYNAIKQHLYKMV